MTAWHPAVNQRSEPYLVASMLWLPRYEREAVGHRADTGVGLLR
ncbi:hypothetical protein [Nocardia abscessus]|nr:hypothetical protein [Nocardia abscessus]